MASQKDTIGSSYDHKQYLGLSRSRSSYGSDDDNNNSNNASPDSSNINHHHYHHHSTTDSDPSDTTKNNSSTATTTTDTVTIPAVSIRQTRFSDVDRSLIIQEEEEKQNKHTEKQNMNTMIDPLTIHQSPDPYIIPGVAFVHTTKDFRPATVQNDILFNYMVKPSASVLLSSRAATALTTSLSSVAESSSSLSASPIDNTLTSSKLAPWITNIPSTRLAMMDNTSFTILPNDNYTGPYPPSLTSSILKHNNNSKTSVSSRPKNSLPYNDNDNDNTSIDSYSVDDITNPHSMTLHLSDLTTTNTTTLSSTPTFTHHPSTVTSSSLPKNNDTPTGAGSNSIVKPSTVTTPNDKLLNIDTLTTTIRTTQGAGRYFSNGSRLGKRNKIEELKCFRCKQTGHFAMNCPNEALAGSGKCFICADPDHESAQCPEAEICFLCDDNGHRWGQCPHRQTIEKEIEIYGRPLGYGHYLSMLTGPMEAAARLLPDHWANNSTKRNKFYEILANPQYPKAEVLSIYYCNACGSSAHSTIACPLSTTDLKLVQCCVCGRMGHSFCTGTDTNVSFPYSVVEPTKSIQKYGICFSCGEKSHYGHQCTKRNRYAILNIGPSGEKSSVRRMETLQQDAVRTINQLKNKSSNDKSSPVSSNKRRTFEESTSSDSSSEDEEEDDDDDDDEDDDDDSESSEVSSDSSTTNDSTNDSTSSSTENNSNASRYAHIQCYNCRNYGHRSIDCPRPSKNNSSSSSIIQPYSSHKPPQNINNTKDIDNRQPNKTKTTATTIIPTIDSTKPTKSTKIPRDTKRVSPPSKRSKKNSPPPKKNPNPTKNSPRNDEPKSAKSSLNNRDPIPSPSSSSTTRDNSKIITRSMKTRGTDTSTTNTVKSASSHTDGAIEPPRDPWYDRNPHARQEWLRISTDKRLTVEAKRALFKQLRKQVKKEEKGKGKGKDKRDHLGKK